MQFRRQKASKSYKSTLLMFILSIHKLIHKSHTKKFHSCPLHHMIHIRMDILLCPQNEDGIPKSFLSIGVIHE